MSQKHHWKLGDSEGKNEILREKLFLPKKLYRCPINWISGKIERKYFQTCNLPQENDRGFASSKCKDVSL